MMPNTRPGVAMDPGEPNTDRRHDVEEIACAAHDSVPAAFSSDKQRWEDVPEWVKDRYIAAALAVEAIVLDRLEKVLYNAARMRDISDDSRYEPALEDVADLMGLEGFGLQ